MRNKTSCADNFFFFKCVKHERNVLLHTDPAGHPSLILVEALDLGQVSGRGALHLETLLRMKDRLEFISNSEI